MTALDVLFSTDYGLMSVAVLLFIIGMAVFFIRYFVRMMARDEARQSSGR